jgi:hypothetical protein
MVNGETSAVERGVALAVRHPQHARMTGFGHHAVADLIDYSGSVERRPRLG